MISVLNEAPIRAHPARQLALPRLADRLLKPFEEREHAFLCGGAIGIAARRRGTESETDPEAGARCLPTSDSSRVAIAFDVLVVSAARSAVTASSNCRCSR